MPLLREEAERMADILEAMLARLSWPRDANHIINIKSTLETIKSTLFTTLVDIQAATQNSNTGSVHDRVDPPLVSSTIQYDDVCLKESSVDDSAVMEDDILPHASSLTSPVHNCIVIGNQVTMEMQEPLNKIYDSPDQDETQFVSSDTSNEPDECCVIPNEQCHGRLNHKPSGLQPVHSKSDEPPNRDILFPMRDQKSLLEIKQALQKRENKEQEA